MQKFTQMQCETIENQLCRILMITKGKIGAKEENHRNLEYVIHLLISSHQSPPFVFMFYKFQKLSPHFSSIRNSTCKVFIHFYRCLHVTYLIFIIYQNRFDGSILLKQMFLYHLQRIYFQNFLEPLFQDDLRVFFKFLLLYFNLLLHNF